MQSNTHDQTERRAQLNALSTRELFEHINLSQSDLGRKLNIDRTTISHALNDDKQRAGGNKLKDVRTYLVEAILENEQREPFATNSQKLLRSVVRSAKQFNKMSIFCGPSGIGKTHELKKWDHDNDDVLYIKIPERNPYASILRVLSRQLDVGGWKRSDEGLERVRQGLKDKGVRQIVADEFDLATRGYREATLAKLGLFRELWDEGDGPSIALVGLTVMENQLKNVMEDYMMNRILHFVTVPSLDRKDLEAFWQWRTGLELNDAGHTAVKIAYGRGNFRMIDNIAMQLDDGVSLDGLLAIYANQRSRR